MRGTLGQEGLDAFLLVGCAAEPAEDAGFKRECLFQRQIGSLVYGFDGCGNGERSLRGDLQRECAGRGEQFGCGNDLIDQADAESFRGGNDVCGEDEAQCGGTADEPRQPLRRSVAGQDAELDLGLAEAGGIGGDAQRAGEGELAAAAECEAVDAGYDRLAAGLHPRHDGLAAESESFAGLNGGEGELVDVGSGGEGLFACSGEQDDANAGVGVQDREDGFEIVEDLGVERVQDCGTIERDGRDGTVGAEEKGFVGRENDVRHAQAPGCYDDTIGDMVKGITVVESVADGDEFARLGELLAALGFEAGKGGKDATGQGAAFLAPVGNLELVTGRMPAVPRILVEVTELEALHAAAAKWATSSGAVSEIAATHWNSRIFTVKAGVDVGFWQSENPLHGAVDAVEGELSAVGMKFAVITTRWNTVITDRLLQGSLDCLRRSGAVMSDIQVVRVPGAWEIPNAARTIAETGKVDAVVTLGCLLRGETAHYEAIYNEVARGIGQSQQETGIPHSFGVLTCETLEQALNRAGIKAGNKGFEAAVAAIEMVSLRRKLLDREGA